TLHLPGCNKVSQLEPLRGMPLTTLSLAGCGSVWDLSPLQGMPLKRLYLTDCNAPDLTPLQGMQLIEISLTPKYITRGMDVLRHMKSLERIGSGGDTTFAPGEFWKKYDKGEFKK